MSAQLPILSFADEVVEKLRQHAPKALEKADATAVHQARVATRRMKSALNIFEPITSGSQRKEFSRVLKKLRKHLGPLRDVDVMLELLAQWKGDQDALTWVSQGLIQQRVDIIESTTSSIDVSKLLARLGAWWGVRQQWLEADTGLGYLIAESVHLQLDRFIEHADRIAQPSDSNGEVQIDPHQLRIAGKELRYTLEFAVASGHRLPAGVTRAFKKMQDELGLWHDYVVLADELLKRSFQSKLGQHETALQLGVLGLIKTSLERSQRQIVRFRKIWIGRGSELAGVIRHAFPLTEVINESEMDRGPADSAESAGNLEPTAADEPSAV